MIYVEVLQCENPLTSSLPSKMLDNTLRFTRSEEDLTHFAHHTNGSPRAEFSIYGMSNDFDDADCWSQEDDEIMTVSGFAGLDDFICKNALSQLSVNLDENTSAFCL